MPKLPEPPPAAELEAIPAIEHVLAAGWRCWRIYFRGGAHPDVWNRFRRFGPTNARFDHHLPPPRLQRRATLYAAATPATCFAEVFQDGRTIDRERHDPWLVCFELTHELRLLDLTGTWPTRAGASMAISSGPRSRARRWSQRIYATYESVEGLYYASSMNANQPAVVLYERAEDALPTRPLFHRALADDALAPAVIRVARQFLYAVV